jgi:magnesium chelatase family protein
VLDRFDLQIEVPSLTAVELERAEDGEPSAAVRARVLVARDAQARRGASNAALAGAALREVSALDAAGRALVRTAMDRGGMSARGVHRALRVARTIADLADEERITAMRLAEALQYRAYEARRFAVG